MRRLLHKLFRRHRFERYELTIENLDGVHTYYVGYNCRCGEPGYEAPK